MLRIAACSARGPFRAPHEILKTHPMSPPEYQFAIFRIKKLRTSQAISRVGRHNDRLGKLPANVDPTRVHLNQSFTPHDTPLLDRVKEKLAGKKYRHDAVKAVEIFCGFSAGCQKFIPIDQWAQASLQYVKRKFGPENLVSAVLHLDEETPHMHFVIIPFVGQKLAAKRIFGARKLLRQMQGEYYDAVKKFGLVRGTKGSTRPHLTMSEIYEGTQEGMAIIQRTLDSIPQKSLKQTWKSYSTNLREHLSTALEPLARAKTAATLAALEIESLRKLVDSSEIATQDQKDRLRKLDLSEVASRLLGYGGHKDGKSTVFEDDARRIVITGSAFRDEKSDARAERGAISLTRHILEVDFETALRVLAQHFPDAPQDVQAEAIRDMEESIIAKVEANTQFPINVEAKIEHFAKKDESKIKALTAHLEAIKGIPGAIIKSLVNHSKLWANRWGSACFHKTDANESKLGVSIVGISSESLQSIGHRDTFFTVGEMKENEVVAIAPDPVKAMQFHAKSRLSVIAVDSIDHSGEVFDYLRAFGVKRIALAEEETWYGKKLKNQWKADAGRAEFIFIDETKAAPKKSKENKENPEQSGP